MTQQPGFDPEGTDKLHTTEILARALEAQNDPKLAQLIERARAGYYHDFLSPLAAPEMQLHDDLTLLGHTALAKRVKRGHFDASAAESKAWGNSAEGQEVFQQLIGGESKPTGANFWGTQRGATEKTYHPMPVPEPETTGIWVSTDRAVDTLNHVNYVVTVHLNEDLSVPLDRKEALEYASTLLGASGSAVYDSAVARQMCDKLSVGLEDISPIITALRTRRGMQIWTAGPISLTPGLNAEMKPFLQCDAPGMRWQWDPEDVEQHARHVLESVSAVADDALYYRYLIEEMGLAPETAVAVVADIHNFR